MILLLDETNPDFQQEAAWVIQKKKALPIVLFGLSQCQPDTNGYLLCIKSLGEIGAKKALTTV